MIFLSSRVGGVGAFMEEGTVPMDDCVLRLSRTPCWAYLRASGVMMFFSLKEVLSHRWKALFAKQASEMSRRRMMAACLDFGAQRRRCFIFAVRCC